MRNVVRFCFATLVIFLMHLGVHNVFAQRGWTPTYGPTVYEVPDTPSYPTITCIAVNSRGDVFAGTATNGVFRSTDHGSVWMQLDINQTGTGIYCIGINDSDWIFVGGLGHARRSVDNGTSWTRIWDDPTQVWDFAFDADTAYMAAWTSLYRYRGQSDADEYLDTIYDICSIAINDERVLYAAVLRDDSTDVVRIDLNAITVKQNFGRVPQTGIPVIAIHSPDSIYLGGSSGIFRSPEDSANWLPVNTGLEDLDIRAICVDYDTVYVGTNGGGIYMSLDKGGKWSPVNDGINDRYIAALGADHRGYVYAATEREGIYRSCSIPLASSCNDLVWADEFNGDDIDTSIWTFDIGGGGWGNRELQWYTNRSRNVRIENGHLIIEAHKEQFNDSSFTSARLKTQGLKCMKYGCIEVRARLPHVLGAWPAIWMLGNSIPTVGWPACGEIDVMEHINTEESIHGTMHWLDESYAQYGGETTFTPDEWHEYKVQWTEDSIAWYIDDIPYHIADIKNGVNGTSEFHKSFFVILNLAVGGNWPGFEIDTAQFPIRFEIDYVRVDSCSTISATPVLEAGRNTLKLMDIYPNPAFNNATISYHVPFRMRVRITIHDMLGQVVARAEDSMYDPGTYSHEIDASALRSGTYLCRVHAGKDVFHKLVIVMR